MIAVEIKDVINDKVIKSKVDSCENCSFFDSVNRIKALASGTETDTNTPRSEEIKTVLFHPYVTTQTSVRVEPTFYEVAEIAYDRSVRKNSFDKSIPLVKLLSASRNIDLPYAVSLDDEEQEQFWDGGGIFSFSEPLIEPVRRKLKSLNADYGILTRIEPATSGDGGDVYFYIVSPDKAKMEIKRFRKVFLLNSDTRNTFIPVFNQMLDSLIP